MKIISIGKHIAKVILKRERIVFTPITNKKTVSDDNKIFFDNLDESKLISKNTKHFKKLVAIDGVGFSGSSALGDFLGEFSNCTSLGGVEMSENPDRGEEFSYEIDFIREPGGIIDLERICYTNIDRLRDNAVLQFIEVCKKYYNNNIPIYDEYFYQLSKKFVKDITAYAFFDSPSNVTYYPKRLTVKEYRKLAQKYLSDFLNNIPSKEYLVCDNLMSVGRPDNGILKDYFGDYKVLMNYCDPRDVYARARLEPGNDWVPVDPEIFVQNWKQNFIPLFDKNDKNLLITNFDDFCNDYESQAKKIMDFLELEEKNHIEKFKYFDPKKSINNTGVWKNLENQKPIEYIFNNLKEFCYDKENKKHYIYI